MSNNVNQAQFMEYASALVYLANGAMAARGVAVKGIETFDGQFKRQQLLEAYEQMSYDYEQIAANLLFYVNNNGMPFEVPPDIMHKLRIRFGNEVSLAAIEDCWYESIEPYLSSELDLLNASLDQSDNVFQLSIKLAAEAIRINDEPMIELLFDDYGILYRTAYYKILIQMRITPIQYPKGLVLKPTGNQTKSSSPEFTNMPLANMELSNPHVGYLPPEFIFMTLENLDGQLSAGTKATVAFKEGTLIDPNSSECDMMIEETVTSWLRQLRKDNNVFL